MKGSILAIDVPALIALALMISLQCYIVYVVFSHAYAQSEGFSPRDYYGTPASAPLTNIQQQAPTTPNDPGGVLGIWLGALPGADVVPPGPCMPGCAPAPANLCADSAPGICQNFETHQSVGLGALLGDAASSHTWYCANPDALISSGLSKTACTTGEDCTGCDLVPLGHMKATNYIIPT